jgi:phage antirepressor YoqD-like protein
MENTNRSYSNSNNVTVLGTVSPSDMGQIFSYNGNSVRMRKMNGYILVCLTDFAKPFPDKNLSHIVNSRELTDYVARMSEIQNCISTDLLRVTKGGDATQQGTWAHHRVAIRVAQKLSTDFAIWVDDKIEELLTTGSASLQPKLPNFNNPAESARAWADQYEKNQMLSLEVQKKEEEKQAIIEETKPAVVFAECVKSAPTNILVRDLAKLITQNGYAIGEQRLYDWLVENKYLIRHKRWSKSKNKYLFDYTPTQRAAEMYLFFVTENAITQGGNPTFIKHTCYVTGKGQVYFLNKFKTLIEA